MTSLRQFATRFVALFRKRKLEQELNDEVRAHIEMLTDENVRRGMSHEEARYAALREFGGVDQTKEVYREHRGLPMIETVMQDIRYGLRALATNRGITAVAGGALGLWMVCNTG